MPNDDDDDDTDTDTELDDELDDGSEPEDEASASTGEPIDTRIGTVDLPDRMERGRYFRELTYLELSALFTGPLKPAVLAKWAELAPRDTIGLVAPFPLTHRKAPTGSKVWDHDPNAGEFRDSPAARIALAELATAVEQLGARSVIFRSPPLFAPSATNRDRLKHFFGEIAPREVVGAERVWIPDGLWPVRAAIKLATELGVTCAFDPLVREPGEPPEIYEDLEVTSLYLRVEGLGRAGGMRAERFEDLSVLLEGYEGVPATVAFASPNRWQDARNLKKLLASG